MNITIENMWDINTGICYCDMRLFSGKMVLKFSEEFNKNISFEETYSYTFELPDSLSLVKLGNGLMNDTIKKIEKGINEMLEMYREEYGC